MKKFRRIPKIQIEFIPKDNEKICVFPRIFVSFVCFCKNIRVHPRIAAWPPRGFTPCSPAVLAPVAAGP
jgi:hypothetical protein